MIRSLGVTSLPLFNPITKILGHSYSKGILNSALTIGPKEENASKLLQSLYQRGAFVSYRPKILFHRVALHGFQDQRWP